MNRRTAGVLIGLLWLAGIGWMLRRTLNTDIEQRLTEAAVRVEPARYYYSVFFRGTKIGAASSAIDTLKHGVSADDYFTGQFPAGDTLMQVSARMLTRLTRASRVISVAIQLNRAGRTSRIFSRDEGDTALITTVGDPRAGPSERTVALESPLVAPTLLGIPLILAEPPKAGRSEKFVVFNPMTSGPEPRNLTILAESLFTVVDSARIGPATQWLPAHRDTVRAWRIGGDTNGLVVWLDAGGRIVSASAPNGVSAIRTAYEIAFERRKAQ